MQVTGHATNSMLRRYYSGRTEDTAAAMEQRDAYRARQIAKSAKVVPIRQAE